MFLIETIKRIIKEMPKVESDDGWCVFEDETDPLSKYHDPATDPANPACPAYPLHDDD